VLLLVPAIARADVGPALPEVRGVRIDFIFTVERDYPDYEFYFVSQMQWLSNFPAPERLPLAPSNPVRVSGLGLGQKEDGRYRYGAKVYAVRKSLLAELTGPPPRSWFLDKRDGLVLLGETPDSHAASLPFTDNRDRIEITYRVELGPDGGRLVKVGENAGNPWVKWGRIAAAVFVSIVFFWIWFSGPGLREVCRGLRWVWRGWRPHTS
jgi:hypothetical protein